LEPPHLVRVFGRGLVREGAELFDEMGLVEVAALVSQAGQVSLGVNHQASLGSCEAQDASEELRRGADDALEVALELAHRRVAIVGQFLDPTLPARVIKQFGRRANEFWIIGSRECLLNQELLQGQRRFVIVPLSDFALQALRQCVSARAEGGQGAARCAGLVLE
jgi:hypothetical protein